MFLRNLPKLYGCALSALIFAAGPLQSVFAIESAAEGLTDTVLSEWPDLRSRTSADASGSAEEDSGSSADTPARLLTREDLLEAFGNLPPLLYTGSFFLNSMNNIPNYMPNSGYELHSVNGNLIMRRSWTSLEEEITEMLSSYQGDWSVYLKDLSSGRTMEINEHSMESASLIKLYIAGAIYEQIALGNLQETDTILSSLDAMITVSDNESSNVLVRQLCDESGDFQTGLAKVNDFIARYGFSSTQQVNGIADPSLWVSDGRVNMTSPADCGRLLEMIYNGELVSHFYSFRFETLLNRQQVNYKIPDGLPEGVHISHKTGEVDDTENDAAIIYTPYGDYIFCIMSTDLTDTDAAVEHIHEVTRLIYNYFCGNALYPDEYVLVEAEPESDRYVLVDAAQENVPYVLVEPAQESDPYVLVEPTQENASYVLTETDSSAEPSENGLLVPYAVHNASGEVEWSVAVDLTDDGWAEVSVETEE
ncbi:hypothetical protein BRYFOR_05056 [Marvinbryantia formatexigens DSM 14469]|uniref:Beta-lactamase class A catalytic domain-containing protein n=1 Tax=Marvinbryantia formatexigens DSM 14469 TaxID=478749 RepID=C6L8W7_9FIRM|nr:serine hydrolase [Marvinbryantia formatexigens]EET62706.1 hypothetical protein BRYFOR_05056 [Marvinbryantia formatexigens DSM 14469]UWO23077.1 serine hydrolase [Marvinbryantia formatexigens DSM 14469]SDF98296.1 Beta-lactamase enzyme family protein [Marvinbryantia formatexigens]